MRWGGGGGEGGRWAIARERSFCFGRSERPKNIGTDQSFGVRFPVALEATRQGNFLCKH